MVKGSHGSSSNIFKKKLRLYVLLAMQTLKRYLDEPSAGCEGREQQARGEGLLDTHSHETQLEPHATLSLVHDCVSRVSLR